jgi:L-ribulose-5-phosphate 4-epimerase
LHRSFLVLLASTIDSLRADVLEAARTMSRAGLVVGCWGNVSARIAGSDLVVVTPSGVAYECLEPAMLVVVSLQSGRAVDGALRPTSELEMHLAIYRARRDVGGVVHTHSVYASAHAVVRREIPPVLEDLAQVVGGAVACARYAPAGTLALAVNVVEALGARSAALLASHGVVGVGPTVAEALRVCQVVEKGAQIHAIAQGLGDPVALSSEDVASLRTAYVTGYGQPIAKG